MRSAILILFNLINVALGQTDQHHSTFHAFLFANTSDKSIGEACRQDLSNIEQQVKVICDATGYFPDQRTFDGLNFDVNHINTLLQDTLVKDNDVVFLYFSSHGGRKKEDTSDFPRIYFPGRDQYLSAEYVHSLFKAKFHLRLLVTLIDACDSLAPISQRQSVYFKDGYKHVFPSVLRMNQVNFYKKLWKYSTGDIIMTSSQKGATSISTPLGSIFTNEFIHTCETFSNMHGGLEVTPSTWNNFLTDLQRCTKAKAFWTSVTAWNDTCSRFPVWKNSITSTDKNEFSDDGYPEVFIQIDHVISRTAKETQFGTNGFKNVDISVTSIGGFPDILAPKLRAVTYYIHDEEKKSDSTIIGSKGKSFKINYQSTKDVLVYAHVEFLDGRELDVATYTD